MQEKNRMTQEQCRMAFPKSSWFGPDKSPTGKAVIPEDKLQGYANEAIWLRKWQFIRFPNYLLYWIKHHAPMIIKMLFFNQVAGKLPDNLIMAQVAPGIFLACKLELKTQDSKGRAVGKLHGKQKNYAENEHWYIARSPEEINELLDVIGKKVEKVKNMLQFDCN